PVGDLLPVGELLTAFNERPSANDLIFDGVGVGREANQGHDASCCSYQAMHDGLPESVRYWKLAEAPCGACQSPWSRAHAGRPPYFEVQMMPVLREPQLHRKGRWISGTSPLPSSTSFCRSASAWCWHVLHHASTSARASFRSVERGVGRPWWSVVSSAI